MFHLERFRDYLEFERGLSPRTLDAYRRDVGRLVEFLEARGIRRADAAGGTDLREFVYHLKDLGLQPSSIRRGLSAVRTYYGFLLAEGLADADPSEQLESPQTWRRLPDVLRLDDERLLQDVVKMDDTVDSLHQAIKFYLTDVSREPMNDKDSRRAQEILSFTINLEHIGDIVDKNLMELAAKKIRNKLHFSDEGFVEIASLHRRLMDNFKLAVAVFMSDDVEMARRLLTEKARFRQLELDAAESHLARLRVNRLESIDTSSIHLDILNEFRRINSHLTSSAYPILERAGELFTSRLKPSA